MTHPAVEVEVATWRPESPNKSVRAAHWGARQRQHKKAHEAFAVAVAGIAPPPLPVVVELTRVSVSKLDAFENLPQSLKPLTDAVAEWLGARSDRDPRITWKAAQAHTAEKELDPKTGSPRFKCYAIVRIWPDPSNAAPAPKPSRPSRAGQKPAKLSNFVAAPRSARFVERRAGNLPPPGGWPREQVDAAIERGESAEDVVALAASLGMFELEQALARLRCDERDSPKAPEPAMPTPAAVPPPSIATVDEGGWLTRLKLNDNPWLPGARGDALARAFDRIQRGNDAIFRIHVAGRDEANAILPNLNSDGLEAWWDGTLVRVACPGARLDALCAEVQAAGLRVDVSERPK